MDEVRVAAAPMPSARAIHERSVVDADPLASNVASLHRPGDALDGHTEALGELSLGAAISGGEIVACRERARQGRKT